MPRVRGDGRGNLYAEIHVELPRSLTEQERSLFEQLAALRSAGAGAEKG
jgi:DnaJ-class molecular chaperone